MHLSAPIFNNMNVKAIFRINMTGCGLVKVWSEYCTYEINWRRKFLGLTPYKGVWIFLIAQSGFSGCIESFLFPILYLILKYLLCGAEDYPAAQSINFIDLIINANFQIGNQAAFLLNL